MKVKHEPEEKRLVKLRVRSHQETLILGLHWDQHFNQSINDSIDKYLIMLNVEYMHVLFPLYLIYTTAFTNQNIPVIKNTPL
jgi:hypothetical protein